MDHAAPTYDPPYDSPIEDVFAWSIVKYLERTVIFEKQVSVQTLCGEFRLDFLAARDGYRVGYECDGREYHDDWRDEWRDAMILGSNHVDVIVRVRAEDIHHRLNDVLYVASQLDPSIFSDRGKRNLKTLASDRAKEFHPIDASMIVLTYPEESKSLDNPLQIRLMRRIRAIPLGQRRFWTRLFEFAQQVGGGSLDDVMTLYKMRDEQTIV